jgi:thiamine biosynthesis lipoprotein ApbE
MVTSSWRALGTSVVVGVARGEFLSAACSAVAEEIAALDAACSRFRDDSDLSLLNKAAGSPVVVSPLLGEAIRVALRAAALTEGDVDPTVGMAMLGIGYSADFSAIAPDRDAIAGVFAPAPGWRTVSISGDPPVVVLPVGVMLDLGATAKALGADRAAAAAHAACGAGVVVSLGGDVAVAGGAPGEGWLVHVRDDASAPPGAPGQHITVRGGGVATSSSTVRQWRLGGVTLHHIVDPRTGAPAVSPYRTVSVAAATCVDANIASTATLVRGASGRDWLQSSGLPARLVTHDGTVVHLNGWPPSAAMAA